MWKNAKAAKIETTVIDLQSKDDRTKEIKAITIISTIIAKIGEDKKVDR
jgi:hypothetical protein